MQSATKYEIIEIDNKEVTFDVSQLADSKSLYINATEIAKQFGKRPKEWLRLKETQDYIKALEDEKSQGANLPLEEMTKVVHGGSHAGTWLHNDLYIFFARWLNPTFAVKCDKKIKELLEGNAQPQISANILSQIVQSNQATTEAVVRMADGMQTLTKHFMEINNEMTRLKVHTRDTLNEMNHTMKNMHIGISAARGDAEQGMLATEEVLKVVEKLEVYYKRDTLTSTQQQQINKRIDEKARELASEHGIKSDVAKMSLYIRLKNYFDVPMYSAIKSESFAKALQVIDDHSLTYEECEE